MNGALLHWLGIDAVLRNPSIEVISSMLTYSRHSLFFSLIVTAAAAVSFLTGCRTNSEGKVAGAERIELTYWPAPNAQEVELADSVVAEWNALHPDIHVTMQPIPVSQSTEEVLLAAIAGKTTPDVCSNIWPGALHEYTQAGGLVPLDRYPGFDSIVGSRTPRELLETFRSDDGHFYQVPWKSNPVMMFYNERMFREAGIDQVPRTFGEYLAAARKIGDHYGGEIWMGERDIRPIWWQRLFDFLPFYIAASSGQTLFRGNAIGFDNVAAQEVLAFFQRCYEEKYFPRTFFQGGDPFVVERKATNFSGPWMVPQMQKFAPGVQYGVAPLPVPDSHTGPVYTYGNYKNIAVFSTTAHPREAWEFVKFLVTARHDLMLLRLTDQLPIRGDLLSNPLFARYFASRTNMVTFARQVPFTRGDDTVPDLKEILDAISQAYEKCAVYGRTTPAQAVHDAAQRVQMIIDWNR